MVDKTIEFVLGHPDFKTLGCGRTDAKVSADDYPFELFCNQEISADFVNQLNQEFPSDIRALSIEKVQADFNILQQPKIKEYHYYFSFGDKIHPFAASLIHNETADLDLEKMQKAARMIQGVHNFKSFTSKPNQETQLEREVLLSEIIPSNRFQADHYPEKTYVFRIKSKGFLRYQVRMLMGTLLAIGKDEISLTEFQEVLLNPTDQVRWIAPGSGLILNRVRF